MKINDVNWKQMRARLLHYDRAVADTDTLIEQGRD